MPESDLGNLGAQQLLSLNPVFPKMARLEAAAICLCFAGAHLLHFLQIDISEGILPKAISALPIFGHKGFVCPFCGGIRAFAYFSVGAFTEALHCSLLGTCITAWLLGSLPLRFLICAFPDCLWSQKLYRLIRMIEHPDLLIINTAGCIWIQLWLHYSLGFSWLPLTQLLQE